MSLLLRVQGLYLLNKQEKTITRLFGLLRIAASQIVAEPQRKRFNRGQNEKKIVMLFTIIIVI